MKTILVMEDELSVFNSIRLSLASLGFDVIHARNATHALEVFDQEQVDLLITDVFVKEDGEYSVDGGVILTGRIRQLLGSDVPVIAISGAFDDRQPCAVANTLKTVGATRIISKPFWPGELEKTVLELLNA